MITLTVYQHVHPGMRRQAADRFAALLGADEATRSITAVSFAHAELRQRKHRSEADASVPTGGDEDRP